LRLAARWLGVTSGWGPNEHEAGFFPSTLLSASSSFDRGLFLVPGLLPRGFPDGGFGSFFFGSLGFRACA
jgi:hypothetical protein